MKEMKDLQKLIEERASQKLMDDISALRTTIRSQPLLKELPTHLRLRVPTRSDPNITEPKDWHYAFTGNHESELIDYWLPKYIERESAEFLKKVDSLQREVDELYNATQTYKP